jgi:hypothetical protein
LVLQALEGINSKAACFVCLAVCCRLIQLAATRSEYQEMLCFARGFCDPFVENSWPPLSNSLLALFSIGSMLQAGLLRRLFSPAFPTEIHRRAPPWAGLPGRLPPISTLRYFACQFPELQRKYPKPHKCRLQEYSFWCGESSSRWCSDRLMVTCRGSDANQCA